MSRGSWGSSLTRNAEGKRREKKKIKKGQRTERQREVEGVLTGGKGGFLEIEKKEEQSGEILERFEI